MVDGKLLKAARVAEALAALGLCALSVRFTWVTVEQVRSRPEVRVTPLPTDSEDDDSDSPLNLRKLKALLTSARSVPAEALPPATSAQADAAPAAQRVYLVVTHGPARSDVYVNSLRIGKTPFVGEVSCKLDEPIRIEVLPPRGSPVTFRRRCEPGSTLRIEHEDER